MSYLNVQVKHNDFDISNITIRYERNQQICTGIGMLNITLVDNGRDYDPWDTIEITELGVKRGEYFISSVVRNKKEGVVELNCQDGSKKLSDYFISDSYEINYYSTTKQWIQKFIAEVGLSYNIVSNDIVPMSTNTQLGLASAYDTIIQLLQNTGWYMLCNSSNTVIIGKLNTGIGNAGTATDDIILDIKINKHDAMLRNKAVVWGNYDPDTENWVYVEKSINTPWNYDSKDKRAIVFSNHNVQNNASANSLANTLLNEFAKINYEKTIKMVGSPEINVGMTLGVNSKYFMGRGIITTLTTTFSNNGLTTTVVLDERCPRLFGFWGGDDYEYDYVYAGVVSGGVWRKPIEADGWESFSTGLPAGCYVSDLYASDNKFACTLSGGEAYYRSLYGNWAQFIPSGLYDNEDSVYYTGDAFAKACSIDWFDDEIVFGVNNTLSGELMRSWVVGCDIAGNQLYANQAYANSEDYKVHIIDLDKEDVDTIVTVKDAGGRVPITNLGYRTTLVPYEQSESVQILPESNIIVVEKTTDYVEGYDYTVNLEESLAPLITQSQSSDRTYAYTIVRDGGYDDHTAIRIKYDAVYTGGVWQVNTSHTTVTVSGINTHYSYYDEYGSGGYFYKDSVNDNEIIASIVDGGVAHTELTFKHIDVNFESDTFNVNNNCGTYSLTNKEPIEGKGQRDNIIYKVYYSISDVTITFYYWKFDQITKTLSTGTIGSETFSDKDGLDATGGFFVTNKNKNGFVFSLIYGGYKELGLLGCNQVEEIGILHGTESSITREALWNRPSEYYDDGITDNFTNYDVVNVFAGDFNSGFGMINAYSFGILDWGEIEACWTLVTYLDNNNILTTHLNELLNPADEDEAVAFLTGETMIVAEARSLAEFRSANAISSKCNTQCYIAQYWRIEDGDRFGVRILKMPEMEVLVDIDPNDYDGYSYFTILRQQIGNDFKNGFYVAGKYNSGDFNEGHLVEMNLNGDITHSYDDIQITTAFKYTANGFVISSTGWWSTGNPTFMYPVNGYYYEVPSFTHGLKTTGTETFDTILTTEGDYKVEISKQTPTLIYNPEGTNETGYISFTNELDSFDTYTINKETLDARIFDVSSTDGFVTESGIIDSTEFRWAMFATGENIVAIPVTLSGGATIIATISGVKHIETTNYTSNPYIFSSGPGISFYQRSPGESTFVSYTSNLPSEITIIRADDVL